MKSVNYNVGEVLTSLAIIESDNRLTELFRTKYGTEFDMVRVCINNNLIKKKAINFIISIAKMKDAPTYQTRNPKTSSKLNDVIQILGNFDNGDCIDGETMEYLIKQIGFEEYLLRSLFLKASDEVVKILLEERQKLSGGDKKLTEIINKASNYLIDSDEANVSEQIEIIKNFCKIKPTYAIDHLDGVQVVEQFEYTFTVEEFLKEIGVID